MTEKLSPQNHITNNVLIIVDFSLWINNTDRHLYSSHACTFLRAAHTSYRQDGKYGPEAIVLQICPNWRSSFWMASNSF